MVADGMLTRKRYREVPPRVDYELTERSRELAPVLGQLARWGYEWAWSPPRSSERVDLGAIFRLVPGLVDASTDVSGSIDLLVSDGRAGSPATYRVTLTGEGAEIAEGVEDTSADAVLAGSQSSWIRALGPIGDREGLSSSGNGALASTLLDLLALGQGSETLMEAERKLESAAS